MYCVHCGNQLDEDAVFCTRCGERIADKLHNNYCANCGEKLEDDAIFCTSCGSKIGKDSGNVFKPQVPKAPVGDNRRKKITIIAISVLYGIFIGFISIRINSLFDTFLIISLLVSLLTIFAGLCFGGMYGVITLVPLLLTYIITDPDLFYLDFDLDFILWVSSQILPALVVSLITGFPKTLEKKIFSSQWKRISLASILGFAIYDIILIIADYYYNMDWILFTFIVEDFLDDYNTIIIELVSAIIFVILACILRPIISRYYYTEKRK